MPSFNDFHLQPATYAVLADMEITEPTPIQAEAIPALLAGRDLVGQSATGSGKTLAYGIPLVERLARDKRVVQALVLVPTRELAIQVNAVLGKLAVSRRLTTALLVGGRPYGSQISALRYGAQIVIGTPGRVKDLLDRGDLVLSQLRECVLDEADQMLDIGFAPVIEEILASTPETRHMALFSATIPDWVVKLQQKFLKDPVIVTITPEVGGLSTIEQIAYQVPQDQKMAALCTLLHSSAGESSLIFGKTKFGVEKLGKHLSKLGFTVGTLHGNKSQRAREEVLSAFRKGQVQTLLATNVAARGLDIQGIHQVINYELPESSDLFTHRVGRTGRMGRQGKAITLLVPADVPKWRRMARNLGQTVALQRLVIDAEASETALPARPATPVIVEPQTIVEAPVIEERRANRERQSYRRPDPESAYAVIEERRPNREPKYERQPQSRSRHTRDYAAPAQERGRTPRTRQDSHSTRSARSAYPVYEPANTQRREQGRVSSRRTTSERGPRQFSRTASRGR